MNSELLFKVHVYILQSSLFMVARTDINDHIRSDCYIMKFLFDPSGSLFRLLFSCSVMSNSLWPHGLRHMRLPCPSPSPRVCSNSCPLSRQCHPTISSSVVPFSSCLQSFPASGSFPMSWVFNQVAKVLELRHQSFQWIFRVDSFRTDWFDLPVVQQTLKSLLHLLHSPEPQSESINSLVLSLLRFPGGSDGK